MQERWVHGSALAGVGNEEATTNEMKVTAGLISFSSQRFEPRHNDCQLQYCSFTVPDEDIGARELKSRKPA